MSYGPYPQYKESGVEWLGEVPEHWNLLPCRSIVTEQNKRNTEGLIAGYLSLMANVGVIPYEEKGDVGNKKPDDLSKCKVVQKGDLVINSMNYGIGSYGLSKYTGVCSPVYIVLEPKKSIVDTRFALRIFEEKSFQSFAQSFGNGILAHRSAIGWDDLKNIGTAIPPLKEQSQIARFLDHETGKIDGLIAEQEKLIELLKEKRQATISRAVTRGLNPDAPMKDSGVEWLGEVPEHWGKVRVWMLFSLGRGRVISNEEIHANPGEFPVYSSQTLNNGVFGYLGSYDFEGDFITWTTDGANAGTVSVRSGKFNCTNVCGTLEASNPSDVSLNFYHYALSCATSWFVRHDINPKLMNNVMSAIQVPKLPLAEQVQIANYLDHEIAKLDSLFAVAEHGIELLKERRSALISAAVTGKIDVRNWKP